MARSARTSRWCEGEHKTREIRIVFCQGVMTLIFGSASRGKNSARDFSNEESVEKRAVRGYD